MIALYAVSTVLWVALIAFVRIEKDVSLELPIFVGAIGLAVLSTIVATWSYFKLGVISSAPVVSFAIRTLCMALLFPAILGVSYIFVDDCQSLIRPASPATESFSWYVFMKEVLRPKLLELMVILWPLVQLLALGYFLIARMLEDDFTRSRYFFSGVRLQVIVLAFMCAAYVVYQAPLMYICSL